MLGLALGDRLGDALGDAVGDTLGPPVVGDEDVGPYVWPNCVGPDVDTLGL